MLIYEGVVLGLLPSGGLMRIITDLSVPYQVNSEGAAKWTFKYISDVGDHVGNAYIPLCIL